MIRNIKNNWEYKKIHVTGSVLTDAVIEDDEERKRRLGELIESELGQMGEISETPGQRLC